MLDKKLMILAIFLVSLLAVSAVSAADNSTADIASVEKTTDKVVNVEENEEILNENALSDGTFTDLANEITEATDELTLNRNYIYNDGDPNWITIGKNITVNGNGYTINGNNEVRFQISYADVILNNINFIKSSMYWYDENGKMTNCNFINCSCDDNYGGAIHWYGNEGILTDCNFINTTTQSGGGAIYWTGEKGTIKNNTFINSTANYGGAIYGTGSNSLITENTITDINNDDTFNAIYWEGNYSTLSNNKIINCTLSPYFGCAIYYWGSNGIITDNTIINTISAIDYSGSNGIIKNHTIINTIRNAIRYDGSNGIVANCTFINTTSAIYWTGTNGTVTNCNFINSTANDCGGAVYWNGNEGSITYCNFINSTTNSGGAVYWNGNEGSITFCNFINTTADLGGAICWDSGSGIITNCLFINTTARDSAQNHEYGGAIYCKDANITITNSEFLNTSSMKNGGAIYSDNANLTVKNSIFINSTSGLYAGAIYCEANCTNLSNCTFINITSTYDYGAIYCKADSVNLSNCAFTSSSSTYGTCGPLHLNVRDNCTITNCNFTNTHSNWGAGAIYIGGSTNHSKANIKNCNFKNTTSLLFSGAIDLFIFSAEIDGCNFINSHTSPDNAGTFTWGDAINMYCLEGSITNCNFINSAEAIRQASVIFWDSDYYQKSNGIISNCTFINANNSKYYAREGGAIKWNIENAILENCNFINCTAENGAALYLGVIDNCTITDCTFKNCFALEHGGPVYLNHGTLVNCNFIDCHAQYEDTNIFRTDGTATGLYKPTNITTTYNSGEKLVATLKVSEKYPLANAKVTFVLWKGFETWSLDPKEICPNCTKTFTTDSNGQVSYSLEGIAPGNYTATITFAGDEIYAASNPFADENTEITINKANTALNTKYDETGKYLIATLKDANGKSVKGVKIGFVMPNGVKYAESDANGIAKYSVKDLAKGSYSVQIAFLGDNNYNPSNKQTVKFTIKGDSAKVATKLTVTSTTATYKSNKYIIATLTDAKGNPISGEKIGFANNGVTYVSTDANGKARYYTKELAPGTYNVNAKFFGNEGYIESNKATSKIAINKVATTLTAKYDATGKNIVATVKDSDGTPVSGIKVGFAINGVKYVTTDANGQAKYSTKDLADNTYKTTIMAYGNSLYENSNKQTLTFTVGNKQQSKIFLRNAQYFVLETKIVKVTLWDANNKPLAGKTVHLTLDEYGLKYTGVTDVNGDVYIKVGVGYGTHQTTVSFDGDDQYTASATKGNIRVIKETPSIIVRDADTHFKVENQKNLRVYLHDRTGQQLSFEAKIVIKLNGMTYIANTYGGFEFTIYLDKVGIYNAEIIYGGNSAYNEARKTVKIIVS